MKLVFNFIESKIENKIELCEVNSIELNSIKLNRNNLFILLEKYQSESEESLFVKSVIEIEESVLCAGP